MHFFSGTISVFRSFFRLSRIVLSVSVGFSGWVSYIVYTGLINPKSFFIFLGIFLLAAGASSLNQYQEKDLDARMSRTMRRPLPAGIISGLTSISISFFLIMPGLYLLYSNGNIKSMFAGILSILWYNVLYTYLKRKTPYALFPGVLTGVGPIMIGWLAAGGIWYDAECLLISGFMCVWQVPHFLLLLLHYKEDYQKAGFPLLTDRYSYKSLKGLILGSVVMLAAILGLFMYAAMLSTLYIQIIAIAVTLYLLFVLIKELRNSAALNYRLSMIILNSYMLLIMILLMLESLVGH